MCGLVGAFRADDSHFTKISSFMWQGLYMSGLRGMGGTGVGLVYPDFDTDYAKSHVSAPNFLCSEEWDWVDKNVYQSRSVMGHTRSATQGQVLTKNSHPFRYTDGKDNTVIAIHNGVIRNWHTLTPVGFSHPVDSAHVTHSLLVRGALPTLEILEGAYVLIWYDSRTKSMHLARNTERELFYAMNEDKTMFWYASEIDMLASLLRRNDIPHVDKFYELDINTLYTFDLTKKVLTPKKTKYEEKKYLPVVSSVNGSAGHLSTPNGIKTKDYTKSWPGRGDYLWCNVADDADVALTLYKPIGDDPETQSLEKHAYGYLMGSRSSEKNSIVKVAGINYLDWQKQLYLIKASIPCKITNIQRLRDDATGSWISSYECSLDLEEVKVELARVARASRLKEIRDKRKNLEHVYEGDEKTEMAEYLAQTVPSVTARSLPALPFDPDFVGPLPKCDAASRNRGSDVLGPDDGGDRQRPDVGVALSHVAVPGPRGTTLTMREWLEIAGKGCWTCEGTITTLDISRVTWFEFAKSPEDSHNNDPRDSEYQMICPCCKDNPEKMQELVA